MLIAISGSQGSGKSTTLEAIKKAGYGVIERKTSRSILNDWGVTLDEVNANPDLTTKFQDEITKRKWIDEMAAVADSNVYFTERTHMDLFAYALVAIGHDNKYSDWLNQYYKTCFAHTQVYHHVYFLPNGCFEVEHDGVRGVNKHYSAMTNTMMERYTLEALPNKVTIVQVCDLQDRRNLILHDL